MSQNSAPHLTGEHVIYKNNGVCRIEEIRQMSFNSLPERSYYVLRPLSGEGTFFLPVQGVSEKRMKKIPTKEEIDRVIDQANRSTFEPEKSSKLRIIQFETILNEGDRAKILRLWRYLAEKKSAEQQKNRALCGSEERIRAAAEKIITEEFSFALNLPKESVISYIGLRNPVSPDSVQGSEPIHSVRT